MESDQQANVREGQRPEVRIQGACSLLGGWLPHILEQNSSPHLGRQRSLLLLTSLENLHG